MSEMAAYGKCMFSFLRNCRSALQSDYPILHFLQQRMTVPVAPHSPQHLVWSVFQILAILIDVWWLLLWF